jgi:hypothetical protein
MRKEENHVHAWSVSLTLSTLVFAGVDGTVKSLKFSEDDRFLAALGEGSANGNDMAIWDMQNGSVAQYYKAQRVATCMCWGQTVVADNTRRVKTPRYSLFTFHNTMVNKCIHAHIHTYIDEMRACVRRATHSSPSTTPW